MPLPIRPNPPATNFSEDAEQGEPSPPTPANPPVPRPDCTKLREAVADAATASNTLWLSYVFALFYLLFAAGGVTHEDLLLERPVKLPFLTVDLPLVGFFWLGPLMLLVAHSYVLLHFAMLADKVRIFNRNCRKNWTERRLLPINIFVQYLADTRRSRDNLTRIPILLIAWFSLLLSPVLLLVFFELQFLPYHSWSITLWHRMALVFDLLLLWRLWPRVIRIRPRMPVPTAWPWLAEKFNVCIGIAALGLVWLVATYPGEWLEGPLSGTPLYKALVGGDVDQATWRPTSFWSNRLVVYHLDLLNQPTINTEANGGGTAALLSLRRRNLEQAVFVEAILPRVDFSCANLRGASFIRAHAQGAWFSQADLSGAQFGEAQLQGASFIAAFMEGALLDNSKLQGANLNDAKLQGAWLESADLELASLSGADLRSTTLDKADLRGSDIGNAWFRGASRQETKLQGTFGEPIKENSQSPRPPRPINACNQPRENNYDSTKTVREIIKQYIPLDGGSNPELYINQKIDQINNSLTLYTEEDWEKARTTWKDEYEGNDSHLAFWRDLVCAADGAPFALEKLIEHMPRENPTIVLSSLEKQQLVDALDKPECAAKSIITEPARMRLKDLLRLQPETQK